MRRNLQSHTPVGSLITAAELIHVHFRACSTNISILNSLKYIMESGIMHTWWFNDDENKLMHFWHRKQGWSEFKQRTTLVIRRSDSSWLKAQPDGSCLFLFVFHNSYFAAASHVRCKKTSPNTLKWKWSVTIIVCGTRWFYVCLADEAFSPRTKRPRGCSSARLSAGTDPIR